jgi:hypothetical protein
MPETNENETLDVKVTKGNKDLIESALNAYWNVAIEQLRRNNLGDLERVMYEKQRDKAKKLMDEIDKFWL